MFKIGDLVEVVESSYYIQDRRNDGRPDNRVGLIKDRDDKDNVLDVVYTVIIVEEDGIMEEYYYYERELRKV